MSIINSSDTTGNRNRHLTGCSAVPKPTAPPRNSWGQRMSKVIPEHSMKARETNRGTNSDYFPIQHYLTGFYNGDWVCFLRGTDWAFTYTLFICNPLKPSGHYMYHQSNIHKLYVLSTQCIYVLCGSENKQRLFPYTALTDWFLWPRLSVFSARYGLGIYIYFVYM